MGVGGNREYNPGWHTALDLSNLLTVAEAIALAGSGRDVIAVGVNCTAPQHLRALLKIARASTDLPLVAYPNRGDTWDPEARSWRSDRAGTWDPAVVASWTALGAEWLGGCCGTRPADIQRLAAAVASIA